MFAVIRIRNVPKPLHCTLKARAALAEALDAPLATARKSGFSEVPARYRRERGLGGGPG